jgi:hypothetical protein
MPLMGVGMQVDGIGVPMIRTVCGGLLFAAAVVVLLPLLRLLRGLMLSIVLLLQLLLSLLHPLPPLWLLGEKVLVVL